MNEQEIAAGLAPTPGYRYADVVGDQLFVAGQVPLDSEGNLVAPESAAAQAIICLDNLKTLVEVHGFQTADVRHMKIFVVGEHQNLIDAWEAVLGWFDGEVPPATLLGSSALGYAEQLVEIDATVIRRTAAAESELWQEEFERNPTLSERLDT